MNHNTPLGKRPVDVQHTIPRGRPNCGLVALAHFTDQPYSRVEKFLRPLYGNNWKGTTYHADYKAFFARVGLSVTWEKYTKRSQQMTLEQWVRQVAQPGVRYMVITTGHAQVVYNGEIVDQKLPKLVPANEYHLRRKKVKNWFVLEGSL